MTIPQGPFIFDSSKRGYQFIAPVEQVEGVSGDAPHGNTPSEPKPIRKEKSFPSTAVLVCASTFC